MPEHTPRILLRGKSPLYANSWRGDVETPAHQMNSERCCSREHLAVCRRTAPTHTPPSGWNSRAYKVRHRWQLVSVVDFNYFELASGGVFDMIKLIPHHNGGGGGGVGGFPTSETRYRRNWKHNFSCLSCRSFSGSAWKPHKEALGVHSAFQRKTFLTVGV